MGQQPLPRRKGMATPDDIAAIEKELVEETLKRPRNQDEISSLQCTLELLKPPVPGLCVCNPVSCC